MKPDAYKRKIRGTDWTNRRFADRLDIEYTLMSHYANARRGMPFLQALRVADLLRCDVEDLFEIDQYQCTACGCRDRHDGMAA